jgi:DNA-binding transcriptional MerR regulator
MPTTATAKRETWRDLLPAEVPDPPELMTSGELLAELNRRGFDVDAETLRLWIKRRILPPPVRRWHNGATRALYHPAYVHAVQHLRELQGQGLRLGDLGPRVERRFVEAAIERAPLPFGEKVDLLLGEDAKGFGPGMSPYAVEELGKMARVRERITGTKTTHIDVAIVGEDGRKASYRIDPSEWE